MVHVWDGGCHCHLPLGVSWSFWSFHLVFMVHAWDGGCHCHPLGGVVWGVLLLV
jgi:hypothetical protein